jgi:hypothetical protein
MHIYVSKEGQQYGPYTVEDLRAYIQQGNFTTADLACCDGENWITIDQVPGISLEDQAVEAQPQMQQASSGQAVESQPATEQGEALVEHGLPRKKKIIWTGIGAAALLVVAIVFWLWFGGVGPGIDASDLDDPDLLGEILEEAIEVSQVSTQESSYTGWTKKMHANGQVDNLTYYLEGKPDGLSVTWYAGGQMLMEAHFIDGKQDGLWTLWHENGEKKGQGKYKAGVPVDLSKHWYASGDKMGEHNHKDGMLMSATVWKPDGVKCFFTNVRKGNGVLVTYHENGTEWFRSTYEDGVEVRY